MDVLTNATPAKIKAAAIIFSIDRISFAKYSGQKYRGKDDKRYLVLNDDDITCRLDEEVELTDLSTRHGVGLPQD